MRYYHDFQCLVANFVYTSVVKFVEVGLPLIDLIDFLLIYQSTMVSLNDEQRQSDLTHLSYPPVPLVFSLL